jgi:hypothetical protein
MSAATDIHAVTTAPASPLVPGTDLDQPMTIPEFCNWLKVTEDWLRVRLANFPGVIYESRNVIRIYPRAYIAARLKKSR